MIVLRLLIGFAYRLVLFPLFAAQAMIAALSNQVHWLITGYTFDQVAQRNARPAFDEMLKRTTRH